jgi:hypothetical protein
MGQSNDEFGETLQSGRSKEFRGGPVWEGGRARKAATARKVATFKLQGWAALLSYVTRPAVIQDST